ncbi:MAG: LEPR-XLL domain-containing protein [Rubrivivax sp.]|nr:LEPR-XLL domain-containing protein [Rubrivivax sp.]
MYCDRTPASKLQRALREAWRVEALEARLLLSADPLTAGLMALAPQADEDVIVPLSGLPFVLSTDLIVATGNISSIQTSIEVDGDRRIEATVGNVRIGDDATDYVVSHSSGTDTLLVVAGGNVTFFGAVEEGDGRDALNGLTVVAGEDVTFGGELIVDGNLTIDAGGIITFNDQITLRNGGSLNITGATQVVFKAAVELQLGLATTPGNVTIEADEIDLQMGDELFSGTGLLTLRAATPGLATALLSPVGAATAGVLNLETAEMRAFADGFSSIAIGQTGQGAMTVGAETALDGVSLRDPAVLRGGTITVSDYSDPNAMLRLGPGDSLALEASGNINLANEIEADSVSLVSSGGSVVQADAGADNRVDEALRTPLLVVSAATGITLDSVETNSLQASNSGAGDIAIEINTARNTTRFDNTQITGAVTVVSLSQAAGSGANDISLLADNGSITLAAGAGIAIAGSGALTLQALGTGSDLVLNAPINVVDGTVLLSAADALTTAAAAAITATGAANITLAAGTGNLAIGAAVTSNGGTVAFVSGGMLDFSGITIVAGPSGIVEIEAAGDLSIGIIEAANAITLRSTGGRILDGLAGDTANLRGEAAVVTLEAASGVGAAGAALRGTVGSLQASTTAGGGIFFVDETALVVTGLGTAGSGDGAIAVLASSGTLSVGGAVRAQASGSGHILLQALAGDLSLGAEVLTLGGSISLLASQALLLQGAAFDVRAAASGQTLDLRAGSNLGMGADVRLLTQGGAQRAEAGAALQLGRADAGAGTVSLQAGGAVTLAAAPGTDVVAGALRIAAGGAVASGAQALVFNAASVAVQAGGAVFLSAGLTAVDSVAGAAVQRVAADGTASALAADAALAGLSAAGPLVLDASGTLDLNRAVATTAVGHARLTAAGTLNIDAALATLDGSLSLISTGDLTASAAIAVGGGGSLDAQAGAALAFSQATSTAGGDMRLLAIGAATVDDLNAGSGDINLSAASWQGSAGALFTADALRLAATAGAAGTASVPLQLQVAQLAAGAVGGGLYLAEADALQVVALAQTTGVRVLSDGTLDTDPRINSALAGLNSGAALVLRSGGALQIGAGATVAATGAALLATTAGALEVGSGLTAGAALSVQSAAQLTLSAPVAGSSVDLLAAADLVMAAGVGSTAASQHLQAGGALTVANLVATGGDIALVAGAALLDADATGDSNINLSAAQVWLQAGAGLGSAANALEIAVSTLAARSSAGGVHLVESDGLNVGSVAFNVNRVAADGSLSALAVSGSGLSALGAAPLVLTSLAGDLGVDAAVDSDGGALRLVAQAGAVHIAAAVDSGGGVLSLQSAGTLSLAAGGSLLTGGADLDVQAGAALTMAAGSSASTGGGDARMASAGVLSLSALDAGTGTVSLSATAVTDGDDAVDVTAARLRLVASSGGLGSSSDALDLAVGQLVASAGADGLYLANTGSLLIDTLAATTIARVAADGSVSEVAGDTPLSDLVSAGALILTNTGSLGLAAGGAALAAGPLRLAAMGSAADLSLAAAVRSTGGHLGLVAGRDVLASATIGTDTAGRSIVAEAGRHLSLGATLATNNGDLLLSAAGDLTLAGVGVSISAGTANAALLADRILDSDADGDSAVDVVAAAVRLTAGSSIGSGANALELQTGTLTAVAGTGAVFLADDAGLSLGAVAVAAERLAADGSSAAVALAAQQGLQAGGAAVLTLSSGDLAVASASTVGSLRLDVLAGQLSLGAAVNASGPVSLLASGNLSLAAAGDVTTSGAGSIDLQSGANLALADGAALTSGSGTLRLVATGSLSLGSLATAGGVSLQALTISDSGTTDLDISAASLQVLTTGTGTTQGFGAGVSPIQLQVGTLAANIAGIGAGGFFAIEADGLLVDTVGPLSINRVAADGSTAAVTDAALSDLVSGGNLILVSSTGALEIREGDADDRGVTGGGNTLLQALAGGVVLGADVVSTAGHLSVLAAGDLLLNADIALERSGRNVDLSAGGVLTMAAGTSVTTLNSDQRLSAVGMLGIDRLVAGSGRVSLLGSSIIEVGDDTAAEVSAAGLRLFAADAVGSEANRLEVLVGTVSARAAGGGIWLEEADALRVSDVSTTAQRVGATGTVTALVDAAQSDLVTTGGNGSIALRTLNGDIDLLDGTAPANGRSITADGSGQVLLSVNGPGAALDVGNDDLVQQGPVFIDSNLRVQGNFVITAGAGAGSGDGAITVDGSIDGNPGAPLDTLELHADGAAVRITGAIGASTPLDSLLIDGATDVTLEQAVTVNGDVTILASGVVTLAGPVSLGTGTLRIVGASAIVLGNVLLGSGDLELAANSLVFNGSITGAADATASFRPAQAGGTVAYGGGTGSLSLSAAQLAALVGFDRWVIGSADTGSVAMAAGSQMDTAGRELTLSAAGDLAVARIIAGSGGVQLLSTAGTVSDSGNDRATDISAAWLLLRGHGPALAAGQSSTPAAIDVDAAVLDLDSASGVTLRDSGVDGRVRYLLLDGGTVYQWLEGPASNQREASGTPGSTPLSAVAEALSALRSLDELRDTRRLGLAAGSERAETGWGGSAAYLQTLTATPAEPGGWLAQRLEQSWLLGTAGAAGVQPAAAGERLGSALVVQFWDEALSL